MQYPSPGHKLALMAGILSILIFVISCKNFQNEVFQGTLTIMQKDAYSDVPGHSLEIWPPHTTTVLKWMRDDGTLVDSLVQVNHGTAPMETNAKGEVLLSTAKVYSFSGTKHQKDSLNAAFQAAVCDGESSKFLSMDVAKAVLEKTFIHELSKFITAHGQLECESTAVDSLAGWLVAEKWDKAIGSIKSCNFLEDDWGASFEQSLQVAIGDLNHSLEDYHVCNNDAIMQVELVKNFMATGEIAVPSGYCTGLRWYFKPE